MSRIKIALGSLEIEYEGEQSFIESSLVSLVEELLTLSEKLPPKLGIGSTPQIISEGFARSLPDATTNTVAQIISAKTGSDLALAAIARINIVKNQPTAPRADILDEMKQASTYYRDTYAGNLSAYLDTLVKAKRINMVARSTYALSASERSRLEPLIASGV